MEWLDYVIFAVFLAISLAIGLYHGCTGGKQKSVAEFSFGNRKLPIVPTTLSLMVSYKSAILILGTTGEVYTRGTQAWIMYIITFPISILLTERLIIPWIYPLRLNSIYQYFEDRFSSKLVRVFGAFLGIATSVAYMGVAIYGPSAALETATGFKTEWNIPLMALVVTIYTMIGGIRGVIWTDVFQSLIMFAGMLAILIRSSLTVGGFGRALDICEEGGRLQWANWSPDPTVRHTVWGFLFGIMWHWFQQYSLQQPSVQRYSSISTLKGARITWLLNIPILIALFMIAFMTGVTTFAFYSELQCDPLAAKLVRSSTQILPHLVKTMFKDTIGFEGLFLATLYSGALSSVSSSLSAAAVNTWEDIFKIKLANASEKKAVLINKALVCVYGVMAMGIAFLAAYTKSFPITQVAQAFVGAVSGPLMGMFFLGGVLPFCEWKGALFGGLGGFGVNLWVTIGSILVKGEHPPLHATSVAGCAAAFNITVTAKAASPAKVFTGLERFYTLSYVWYVLFGATVTVFIGSIISAISVRLSQCQDDKNSEQDNEDARLYLAFGNMFRCDCREKQNDNSTEGSVIYAKKKDQSEENSGTGNPNFMENNHMYSFDTKL